MYLFNDIPLYVCIWKETDYKLDNLCVRYVRKYIDFVHDNPNHSGEKEVRKLGEQI